MAGSEVAGALDSVLQSEMAERWGIRTGNGIMGNRKTSVRRQSKKQEVEIKVEDNTGVLESSAVL